MQSHSFPTEVLGHFGLSPKASHSRVTSAVLTAVYLVDNCKILRGRPLESHTVDAFVKECALLDETRQHTTLQLPQYLTATNSARYVIHRDTLWTLHNLIPHRALGDWRQLHESPPEASMLVLQTMRSLHDATKGKLSKKFFVPRYLLEITKDASARFKEIFPPHTIAAITHVQNDLSIFIECCSPDDAVFIHGDFHHGNFLVDAHGKPSGLIDLNWAHTGHYLNDLGYTLMMLIRDYKNWNPEPQMQRYLQLASAYGVPDETIPLLCKHSLLFSVFECTLFEPLIDYRKIFDYQVAFTKHFEAAVHNLIS